MPLFSSRREQYLWVWTLTVVVAIYSTLGLARTLAAAPGDSGFGVDLRGETSYGLINLRK